MFVEKKDFNVYEFEKEEAYLNQKAEQGFFLIDYNQNGYVFEKREPLTKQYLVEYYPEEFHEEELSFYTQQGFELVTSYLSNKGLWLFFVRDYQDTEIMAHRKTRQSLIEAINKRLEYFGLLIIGVMMVFSVYMYILYKSMIFMFLIIISVGLFVYLLILRNKLKKMLK